jgi:phosphatidate cytidylyltransferase
MTAQVAVIAGALGVGGVGAFASGQRELVRRWVAWTVIAAVVAGALSLGVAGAAALAAALGVVASWEASRLLRLTAADRIVLTLLAIALPVLAAFSPAQLPRMLFVVPVVAAAAPLLAGDTADGTRRASTTLFVALWLAPLAGVVLLGHSALAVIVAVSIADVAAWCGGRSLGRRGLLSGRLSPLSPNKTYAGLLAGAIGGAATLLLFDAATPALLVAVCLGGPLGDLLESMVKRSAGVKDAGRWLPGFGGLLDRIDSLLVALAVAVALTWNLA